jgi:uncharacterized membrane protein YfhO
VISESFNEGWSATIDGNRVQVERINGDFFGCVVPAGDHLVAFDFVPAYRVRGGIVSLTAVSVTLGVLVIAGISTRRVPRHRRGVR